MKTFDDVVKVADILLGKNGCIWDKKQTAFSLQKHLIEEVHEVLSAIDNNDISNLKEELGDVLYTLIFIAKVEKIDISEITTLIHEKFTKRHPHVFANEKIKGIKDVEALWNKEKEKKNKRKSILDGILSSLPLLLRAQKIISKIISNKKELHSFLPKINSKEKKIAKNLFDVILEADKEKIDIEGSFRRYLLKVEANFRKLEIKKE